MSWATDIAATEAAALAEFGEAVTYTPAGGAPAAIVAVFDEFYVEQRLVDDHFVQQVSPAFVCDSDDVSAAGTEGDTITRGATVYYVTGIEKSGGLTVLKVSTDATA